MSRSAADLLIRDYDVDAAPPAGDPARRARRAARRLRDASSRASGVAGRDVILSFGLLGPGKGYELAIEALPAVAAAHPDVLYVIVGATHPDLISTRGRGLPAVAHRPDRAPGHGGPRPVRRSVRRPRGADAVAAGGGRLRDALSEPRPDRLRDAVLRDGRRPGGRLDAIRLREGAAGRRPRRPRRARLRRRRSPTGCARCSATRSCAPRSAGAPTPTAGG